MIVVLMRILPSRPRRATGLMAACLPSRRASRIDPTAALRVE